MTSTLEAKKFLEGWASFKSESAKSWKKCWIVLRGTSVLLFSSDKPGKDNTILSLSLGLGTKVVDIKSKKEFKFELSTMNQEGQTKKNIFKFNNDNDCRLWKAYIVAIATGSIPTDCRLLPGQQSDVYEAMIEVRKQNGAANPTAKKSPTTAAVTQSQPPDARLRNTPERQRIEEDEIEIDDPAIRQLHKRLEELAKKEISDSELTLSVSSWPIMEIVDPVRSKGSASLSSSSSLPFASPEAAVAVTPSHVSPTASVNSKSSNVSKRTSFVFSNHAFYSDGDRKSNGTPSWFVNCSRDQAEAILTTSNRFGTVLMRASSAFPINGNYVISFRRELQGKVVVSHYNIIRTEKGFKIDVENKHSPMPTLSIVMEFFLSVSGKTAKPLTSNDLTELLGKYQAAAFPPVVEEDAGQLPSNCSSIRSYGLPSVNSQPSMSGSNRSSSIGSQSSRNSRGSFDFTSRRPSDTHSHQLPSDDGCSSATSSVFYDGHASAKASSEVSGSPPSYGGTFSGSMYGDGAPGSSTRDLRSGSTRSFLSDDVAPSLEDNQIYSNESEAMAPENPISVQEQRINGSGSQDVFRGSADHYGSNASDVSRNGINGASGQGALGDPNGHVKRGFDTRIGGLPVVQHPSSLQNVSVGSGGGRSYLHGTMTSDAQSKQNSSKQLAPAPPPKPGPHEIYMLMKPLPPSDGDYSSASDVCGTSDIVDSLKPSTSVKELARMLQCSLEK